ncbi:MAG: DUF4093 domain-containing protein [Clostridia bacterium]|nr:DUF4093 domain-containing protein [Clostridia bacterium]
MNKISVKEVIVVEGRYDKERLSALFDALILTTDGFRIYRDKDMLPALRRLAQSRGLIILTDPDRAGFQIRNYIKSAVDKRYIKEAYIPDIPGKEKRKDKPSKEGLLGVEGVPDEIIIDAIIKAGATEDREENEKITKADLMRWGLSGSENSRQKRMELQRKMKLPARLSANALLDVLNALHLKEEMEELF